MNPNKNRFKLKNPKIKWTRLRLGAIYFDNSHRPQKLLKLPRAVTAIDFVATMEAHHNLPKYVPPYIGYKQSSLVLLRLIKNFDTHSLFHLNSVTQFFLVGYKMAANKDKLSFSIWTVAKS